MSKKDQDSPAPASPPRSHPIGSRPAGRVPLLAPSILLLGSILVALIACYSVLLPFALAIFLAYLIYPVVRLIHRIHIGRHHVPRWLGVILIYAAIIGGGIPLATKGFGSFKTQIVSLGSNVDRYVKTIREWETGLTDFIRDSLEVGDLRDDVRQDLDGAFRDLWDQALAFAAPTQPSNDEGTGGQDETSADLEPEETPDDDEEIGAWLKETPVAFQAFHDELLAWIEAKVEEENTYKTFKRGPDAQAHKLELPDADREALLEEVLSRVRDEARGRLPDEYITNIRAELAQLFESRLPSPAVMAPENVGENIYDTAQQLFEKHQVDLQAAGFSPPLIQKFAANVKLKILVPAFAREEIATNIGEGFNSWLENLQKGIQNVAGVLTHAQVLVEGLVGGIFQTFLVMMLAAFFIVFFPGIRTYFRETLPPRYHEDYENLLDRLDSRLSGVIRGQIIICTINGILTYVGLSLLGVKYPTLLAIVASLLSLIPIFGTILSTVPAALIAWTDGFTLALMVVGWVLIIHAIEAYLLNPNIMGHSAHMNPLLVVFLLLAGEHYGGMLGALLAVPVGSLFITLWIFAKRKISEWFERMPAAGTVPPG